MNVTKTERAIIETMLAFANLPRIDSRDQVQAIFRRLPFPWAKHHDWIGDVTAATFRRNDLRRIRRWLKGIVEGNASSQKTVRAGVNRILARTVHLRPYIDQSLRLAVRHLRPPKDQRGGGVEEYCALGVAYLFDRRLLRRVRQCPLPRCGRYRVTYEGRVWNYHSVEHQREGERLKAIERVKQWRAFGPKRKRKEEQNREG